MTSTAVMRSPLVSAETLEFATKQGVDPYLLPVLSMTERVFPEAWRTELRIEDDPEIPEDFHLTIEVCLTAVEADQYVEAKFRWGQELFRLCPAELVCVFRCRVSIVEP